MELIFLLLGVGVGFIGSQVTRSFQKPVVSTPSLPQQTDSNHIQSDQENIEPPNEILQPFPEETKPLPADIEPLKEELKQTQLAYRMAKEMSQFKGGFLARTAHELRSPLSSLIGMHQLILSDLCDSPEEAKEFVAQANTSALKMVKLIDEVIAVSKTEHGTNRLEILSVPLSQVFDEVFSLTYLQAANNNLQFDVVPPDPSLYVLTDPRRFRQVLVGIVDTAIAQLSERKEGSVKVWGADYPNTNEVRVWIDVQSPTPGWSEVVDLLSTTSEVEKPVNKTSEIPPGLTLLMVQNLVDVMQGKLEVLPLPDEHKITSSATEHCVRLQCSMPLATPEPVEQALV